MHALHHCSNALQTHARIDRRFRQWSQLPIRRTLKLHEHEIPDLNVTIALFVRRTGRPAWNSRPVVVENLAAGATRTRIAHSPEVRLLTKSSETLGWDANVLEPDVRRLIVITKHRDPKTRGIEFQPAREEVPRESDGIALEVVSKRKVTQHFEECMVPRRIADILQIVVLATRADAPLARSGADIVTLLLAQEHVLELDHAGIGEQQCGVISRNERARRHDRMAVLAEKLQEGAAYVRRTHIRRFIQGYQSRSKSAP